jgi:hypothetical protein
MHKTKLNVIAISILVSAGIMGTLSPAAAIEVSCTYTQNKKTAFCSTDISGDTVWRCDKKKGGTWSCVQLAARAAPAPLKNAVTGAVRRAKKGR